jgi:hypothetical protein
MPVGKPAVSSTKAPLRHQFLEISSLMLLCCFTLLNYVLYPFFLKSFTMKPLQKSNLNTIWDCSNYTTRKCSKIFGLYNPKPPRLCGLWRFTQCLDSLWYFNAFFVGLCILNVSFDSSYIL